MSTRRKPYDVTGIAMVVLTLLGWSSVLLFLRHLADHIDVWTANGWRYGLSALLWLPLLVRGLWGRSLPPGLWWRAIMPAVANTAGQVCFAATPYYIGPGLASFLLRLSLISSTAGAFVLFSDERALIRSRAFWAGMGLVVLGSLGTVLLGRTPIEGGAAVGVLLGAAAGALYGLYAVAVRYWMRGIPAMTSFAVISLYTAVCVVGLMLALGESAGMEALELSAFNWTMLVLSALIGIALGHVFFYAAMARLGVAVTTAVIQLAPFITGAASVVLFGEILTGGQWGSGAVLLIGGVLLLRAEQMRPKSVVAVRRGFPVAGSAPDESPSPET